MSVLNIKYDTLPVRSIFVELAKIAAATEQAARKPRTPHICPSLKNCDEELSINAKMIVLTIPSIQ